MEIDKTVTSDLDVPIIKIKKSITWDGGLHDL